MKFRHILPIGALLLCAATAWPQDAAAPARDLSDLPASDVAAARRTVEDEAQHRDRLGRIHRLRELYAAGGNRERLAQLDDLERREGQGHEARRIRNRAGLSEPGWQRTQDFISRGGVMRARMANHPIQRERTAAMKDSRERGAQASRPTRASRPAAPSRPAPRGGRSPR